LDVGLLNSVAFERGNAGQDVDLARNLFQAHGAGADGVVLFRRKLTRAQLLKFTAAQLPCVGWLWKSEQLG
jgi:hypothetical protein